MAFEMEGISWIIQPNGVTKVFLRERQEVRLREGDVTTEEKLEGYGHRCCSL